MKQTQYKDPLLVLILHGFALFTFGGAVVMLVVAGPAAFFAGIISGLFLAGFAHVIKMTSLTAYNTERTCLLLMDLANADLKKEIQKANAPRLADLPAPSEGPPKFYYHDGKEQAGPFTLADLKDFLSAGIVSAKTYVVREGESEWTTLGSVLA